MDKNSILSQIDNAKKAGVADDKIWAGLQNFSKTLPIEDIEGRAIFKRTKSLSELQGNLIAANAGDTTKFLTNPIGETIMGAMTPVVKGITKAAATTFGGLPANFQAQLDINNNHPELAESDLEKPFNFPILGNINPGANTGVQNAGLAAEVAAQMVPSGSSWLSHIVSPAVSGALWSGGAMAAGAPGATPGEIGGEALKGGLIGAGTGAAIEIISRWPQIKAGAQRLFAGSPNQIDWKMVDPKEVNKFVNDPSYDLQASKQSLDAVKKADAIKLKEYKAGVDPILAKNTNVYSVDDIIEGTPEKSLTKIYADKGIHPIDPELGLRADNLDFSNSTISQDVAQQGKVKSYLRTLQPNDYEDALFLQDANAIKSKIGNGVDWVAPDSDTANSLGKQTYHYMKDFINQEEPSLATYNDQISDWLEKKSVLNKMFPDLSRGGTNLNTLFGPKLSLSTGKGVKQYVVQELDDIAGTNITQLSYARALANNIISGKGPYGAIIGSIAGGVGGAAVGGGLGAIGGSMIGKRLGRTVLGPNFNRSVLNGAVNSLVESPIGQKVITNALPQSANLAINQAFQSLNPQPLSPGQQQYQAFADAYREHFPSASDVQTFGAYQKAVAGGWVVPHPSIYQNSADLTTDTSSQGNYALTTNTNE